LPAEYLSANKAGWRHVIKARTGGYSDKIETDNITLQYYNSGLVNTGSTYPSAISSTTTWYVSESNGACEGPRVPVTATVIQPDPLVASSSGAVCLNGTVTLTATTTSGTNANIYKLGWTSTNGSGITGTLNGGNSSFGSPASVTVTPTAAGTYTYFVSGVDSTTGTTVCSQLSSVSVVVKALPRIDSVKANKSTLCLGDSVQLTAYSGSLATGPQTLPLNGNYCTCQGSAGDPWISNVTFNTLNRSSGQLSTSPNYEEVPTSVATTTVNAGQTYTFSMTTAGTTYTASIVSVWIDWNRDGTLAADEWYQPWTAANSGSINITVPANAQVGATRMRVRSRGNGNTNGAGDACTTFGSGEGEDYTINVISGSNINTAYGYTWNPGGAGGYSKWNTPTASGSVNYTVTAYDAISGCSNTSAPVTVLVRALPTAPTVTNSTQCGTGVPTATAAADDTSKVLIWYANATGGTPLQTGGSTYRSSVSSTTTFYVTAYDGYCEGPRAAVTVTVTPPPAITLSPSLNPICFGQSSTLSVTSGNADYSYSWTGGTTGASLTVSPTSATTYTVFASDNSGNSNNGCKTSASVTIGVNPNPAGLSSTVSDSTVCKDQTITLAATTTVTVTGPQTLPAAVDATGYGTSNATLTADDEIFNFTIDGTGLNNSSTCATVAPGNGSLAAQYSNYTTGFPATTLNAGTSYSGSITIGQCATGAYTTGYAIYIDLNRNGVLEGTENVAGDVAVTSAITGTTRNFSFLLPASATPGATLMRVIAVESYSGASGCTASCITPTGTYSWGETEDYVVNIQKTGSSDTALLFSWSSTPAGFSANTKNASGVRPAQYSGSTVVFNATATNPLTGCSSTVSKTVYVSDLKVQDAVTNVLCNGQSTGSITATGSGGMTPYTFSLNGSNYSSNNVFNNKAAGTYYVRIKDVNTPACVVTDTVVITQPSVLAISATPTNPVCRNDANGSIVASATGGNGAYQFALNGGTYQSSGTFNGLTSGSYTVTVKDDNGCTKSTSLTLSNPSLPPVSLTNNGPVCAGANAVLTASTGLASYSFSGPGTISNTPGDNTATVAPLADSSVYSVTITDGNGCPNTASTVVRTIALSPVSVSISAYPGTDICSGTRVRFTATPVNGGTSPSYSWYINGIQVPGATADTFSSNTLMGNDQVYARLNSSITCTSGNPANSNVLTITETSLVIGSMDSVKASVNNVCVGTSVTYTAFVTAGIPDPVITFYVNGNAVQSGISNTYSHVPADGDVVVASFHTDYPCAFVLDSSNALSPVTMVVYPIPAAPTVTVGGATTFCNGGSVTLTSSYTGGNTWTGGATSDALVVTMNGSYSVKYTSQYGCVSPNSAPTVVTVNANPTVSISGSSAICPNTFTTLSAVASAGSGTISSYAWTLNGTTDAGNTQSISVNTAGSYTVTVTNSNGCSTTSAALALAQSVPPTAAISASCTSLTPGQTAVLTGSPASAVTYAWSLDGGNTLSTSNPYTTAVGAFGTYKLKVTSTLNGCQDSTTVAISSQTGAIAGGSTFTIPSSSCGGFLSINAAAQYLNANGVTGSGPITFNVAAGYTETAPARGITFGGTNTATNTGSNSLLTTQSSATPIVFQKSGTGANPLVTASGSQTAGSVVDAVIRLRGADYFTFDGIDVRENAANQVSATASNNMTEFGYALFANDTTNGSQNNTIRNCNISLISGDGTSIYPSSFGIYSNARHNADSTTTANITDSVNGTNSFNKYYSNSISGVNIGIALIGSTNINRMDKGNDIGGTSASTGNTITNWGGYSTAASYPSNSASDHGIFNINQLDNNISYNTITSRAVSGTAVTLRGILVNYSNSPTATTTTNVNNNTITLNSGFTSGAFECISTQGISTANANATINVNNNNLVNSVISGAATSTAFLGIANLSAPGTLSISGNTISGVTTTATTGGFTGLREH